MMDFWGRKIDKKALDSFMPGMQIHYYNNLPKHIRVSVSDLSNLIPNEQTEHKKPAHVAYGAVAIINGKLNIPFLIRSQR